jgi:hypothetical protein
MVKKLLGAIILSSFLTVSGWAATPNPSVIATPPQPHWNELTRQQKTVLAPLSGDWDAMEYYRRKKWIGIAERFPNMAPDEQRRLQGQMQEWAKLTPEQRRLAREKFQTVNQLPTEKKQELKQKWEEYSNLPEEEKEKHKPQASSIPVAKPGRAAAAGAIPPAPVITAPAPAAPVPAEPPPPAATSDNTTDNTPRP